MSISAWKTFEIPMLTTGLQMVDDDKLNSSGASLEMMKRLSGCLWVSRNDYLQESNQIQQSDMALRLAQHQAPLIDRLVSGNNVGQCQLYMEESDVEHFCWYKQYQRSVMGIGETNKHWHIKIESEANKQWTRLNKVYFNGELRNPWSTIF